MKMCKNSKNCWVAGTKHDNFFIDGVFFTGETDIDCRHCHDEAMQKGLKTLRMMIDKKTKHIETGR